mmetsp:Transcript_23187/g.71018  ORF Transcript_23187/g.71018 Transcript_23187/m.71018 type:complete len:1131 (+) Transcript_23187:1596-4988(+)
MTPTRLGSFGLRLYLGEGEADRSIATPLMGELRVEVKCPYGLVPDFSTMICTCDQGYQPNTPADPNGAPGSLANGCKPCRPGHFKSFLGEASCEPCHEGSAQPKEGSAYCEECIPGTFQRDRGQPICEVCPPRTNSTVPYVSCDICEAGRYRKSVDVIANADSCRECPAGTECPYGSTVLSALLLMPGTWRISGMARQVELCQTTPMGDSACKGGFVSNEDGQGYCATGHLGPLCEVCSKSGHYFDWRSTSCVECPPATRYLLVYFLLIGIPAALVLVGAVIHRRSPKLQQVARRTIAACSGQVGESKIKMVIGFVQVVAVIGNVYSIRMPDLYRYVLLSLEIFYLDIFSDIFAPSECLGGYANLLLAKAAAPIVFLALAGVAIYAWCIRQELRESANNTQHLGESLRKAGKRSGLIVLPLALWVTTFFCVNVSSSIFGAFHCRRFVDDSDSQRYREFLVGSLDVECPTDGHSGSDAYFELRAVALILVGVWPLGYLASMGLLLIRIRSHVLLRRPSELSHAARMLTRDYKPAYFWWDFVDLLRKLLLTGFVLVVPERIAFLRLVVALIFSVLFLVAQTVISPFKRYDNQLISLGLQMVISVLLLGSAFMYAYQRFEVALSNGGTVVQWQQGRLSPLSDVFAFESLDQLALVCLVAMAALAVALLGLAVHVALMEVNADQLKLRQTRAPPILSLPHNQRYHMFLSHVWSTGQDQVAVIKRQLSRMMPGIRIFLDVDDLEDIGRLEEYVDRTMVVLIFLSRGYFNSRNCLREARACMALNKPIVLVVESDVAKGGLSREEAIQECPEDLRDYIFGNSVDRPLVPWHRITVFQVCSLKEIARAMLIRMPTYAAKAQSTGARPLDVYLDKEVSLDKLRFQNEVLVYASPNNPGCIEMANELTSHFQKSSLRVVERPPEGMLSPAPKRIGSESLAVVVRNGVSPTDVRLDEVWCGAPAAVQPPRGARSLSVMRSVAGRLKVLHRRYLARLPRLLSCTATGNRSKEVFLLYLNRHTFGGEVGAALTLEVQHAMERDIDIVMVHENDSGRDGCEFAELFKTTPPALLDAGLYGPLAFAMHPPPHRNISLALVAQALGASTMSSSAKMVESSHASKRYLGFCLDAAIRMRKGRHPKQ